MNAIVYAQKVNMREELLQQIPSAATSINNAAVLRKVTSSLVTRVRQCIQADKMTLQAICSSVERQTCTFNNIVQ